MGQFITQHYERHHLEPIIRADVQPGTIMNELGGEVQEEGKSLEELVGQLETIVKWSKNWQHPLFFGYYSMVITYPTILGSLWNQALGHPATHWIHNPSMVELENIVINYTIKLLNLPFNFHSHAAGGFINSISEGYFLSLHYAKTHKMKQLGISIGDKRKFDFVAYTFRNSSSWSSKALKFKDIQHVRILNEVYNEKTGSYQVDYQELKQMIEEDEQNGLIPFWLGCTLGTTLLCSFDDLTIIGPLCQQHNIILSVDAAYAGTFQCLPECQYLFKGQQYVDIYLVNFAKQGGIGMAGAVMYVKDKASFMQHGQCLPNAYSHGDDIVQYDDWSSGHSRRSSAINLYLTLHIFGINKYKNIFRRAIFLAKVLEALIKQDKDAQLMVKRHLGLVCFRFINQNCDDEITNTINQEIIDYRNNNSQFGYVTLGQLYSGTKFIRCAIGSTNTCLQDIFLFWDKLQEIKSIVFQNHSIITKHKTKIE